MLVLLAEVGMPVGREGLVWQGIVTVQGTLWLGPTIVASLVCAIVLLAWYAPRWVRAVTVLLGVGVFSVVLASQLGRLQERFVEPLNRVGLLSLEVSVGLTASLALRALGRTTGARLALVAVLGTIVFTAALVSGAGGGVRWLGLSLSAGWLASRLLRYAVLVRLIL